MAGARNHPAADTTKADVDAAALAFAELFAGLERAFGVYELFGRTAGGAKVQGKARTVRGELSQELWRKHLLGEQGLGIVPIRDDSTAMFGAIDVDQYDLRLDEVEAKCAALHLPLLPTRTKSGGVHLYMFGAEPLPAALVKQRLEEWAVSLGFAGAEVFPKQAKLLSSSDVGNWINMPYFGAINGTTERYAVFKGQELPLNGFLQRAKQLRVSLEQLDALVLLTDKEFEEGPPCLQSLGETGFPEGTRNNGLFAVGVYLKKRYPDDWAAHLHSYNTQFFKPPLTETETKGILKQLHRKDYNYTCDKPPIKNYCNKGLCRTREFGVGKGTADWGVVIDSDVLCVMTKPPYWIVTVNGTRMQLFSEHLMQQRLFMEMCVNTLGFMPTVLPADKWRVEVNKMLANSVDVEAPPDSGAAGELEYYLKQFCTVFPQAETREEIVTGKPFIDNGVVHFRGADFKRFLDANHFRSFSGAKLFAHLRACGVSHKQMWVGEQNMHVWCVDAYKEERVEVPPRTPNVEGEM